MEQKLFESIYVKYYKPVCKYICKIAGNQMLAEDLAQETFIKAFIAIKPRDEGMIPAALIYKIARNTCIDFYRKNIMFVELTDDSSRLAIEENSPEDIVINKEKRSIIIATLEEVDKKYRTPLVLRGVEELSYQDIAAEMRLSIPAVKTLIYRARQQFRRIYSTVC